MSAVMRQWRLDVNVIASASPFEPVTVTKTNALFRDESDRRTRLRSEMDWVSYPSVEDFRRLVVGLRERMNLWTAHREDVLTRIPAVVLREDSLSSFGRDSE